MLQAKIEGIEVYTIDSADFDERLGFDIKPIDHLILTKNAKPYPGIEWEIDAKGDTENVFYVVSESRLNERAVNFQKLMNSTERGSSLKRIEVKETYAPGNAEDYKKIKAEFKRMARSLIRESKV